MDIEVLRNYAEIIESGSITAAAKKLYTAQATLSMQLKSLEKELGTVLLIRTAHRLELTEAGRMLYRRAKSISAIDSQIKSDIKELEKGGEGTVRIGISSEEWISVCGDILSDFARIYPKMRFEIYEKPDHEILAMTEDGSVTAAFVRTPCTISADMEALFFESEPMAAVYSPEHFSMGGETSGIAVLTGKRLAVRRKYSQLLEDVFAEKMKKSPKKYEAPVIAVAAESVCTVLSAAERGMAVGILPLSAAGQGRNTAVKVIDEPMFYTQRIIVSKKSSYASSAERKFLEYAAAQLRDV
ncbi:MAG: LysR family transcriptional regulator [Oscillospiraceae bacterium]|nr:LysR family transcriptional regulator [Oscillospiraceae bacterium]